MRVAPPIQKEGPNFVVGTDLKKKLRAYLATKKL